MLSTKISAVAIAGAITTLLVTVLTAATDFEPTPEAVAALTTLIAVVVGYFVKDSSPAPSADAAITAKHISGQVPHP